MDLYNTEPAQNATYVVTLYKHHLFGMGRKGREGMGREGMGRDGKGCEGMGTEGA